VGILVIVGALVFIAGDIVDGKSMNGDIVGIGVGLRVATIGADVISDALHGM
jgi:hypothetical protein